VQRWLARDPLKLARARLLQEGLSEAELEAVEEVTNALMEQAVQTALAAPYPDPATEAATEFAA
jgi:pyruvate dehydrogenase E1 component alpha subunit